MKILKLIIFSIIFILLLLPTSCSSWLTLGDFTGRNKYENPDYVNSPFYTTNDEIGYYTDWCKKNNYGGRKLGTEEEKLSKCIDAELRVSGLAWAFGGINQIFTAVILPIFLIYLYFYIKWLRKNYFKKINKLTK